MENAAALAAAGHARAPRCDLQLLDLLCSPALTDAVCSVCVRSGSMNVGGLTAVAVAVAAVAAAGHGEILSADLLWVDVAAAHVGVVVLCFA